MPQKLKLVISKPKGFKGGRPLVGLPSRLVNMETGEEVPGLRDITLGIPLNGVLTCTAEILLGDIEVVEEPAASYVGAEVERAERAGLSYELPPLAEKPEPGNGEIAPK